MRRLVFINRYYFPDHSATAQLLTDLAKHLVSDDYEVHIITSRSIYDDNCRQLSAFEMCDGVNVHRVWTSSFGRARLTGRAVDYLSFYISSFFTMLRLIRKGDVVIAKTDPPLISILAAIVAKLKKAALINWLQDLFPEVGKKLGVPIFRVNSFYDLIKWLRNWSLKVARKNIVLGEVMRERVTRLVGNPGKVDVIANWVVGEGVTRIPKVENFLFDEWGLKDKFIVGYSGNLGRAHDYMTLFQAAKMLSANTGVMFLIVGGGAGYQMLREMVTKESLANVMFKPYQPIEQLSYSLSIPDIHIITLESALEGLIVPSKYYGVLGVSKPIIYIGSSVGDIGSEITQNDCGKVVDIGDADGLKNLILRFNESLIHTMENNAKALFTKKYEYGKSISKWKSLFLGLK